MLIFDEISAGDMTCLVGLCENAEKRRDLVGACGDGFESLHLPALMTRGTKTDLKYTTVLIWIDLKRLAASLIWASTPDLWKNDNYRSEKQL